MKKLRSRLFFHFSIQFGFISLLMILVVFLATLIGGYFLVELDREADYYQYQLDELVIEVGDPLDYRESGGDIEDVLRENMWLQIIDEEGNVIVSGNVPANLKESYSNIDIEQMKEWKQVEEYSVKYTLETPLFAEAYLFVLGYKEPGALLMDELIENVNINGSIAEADQSEVETKLDQLQGTLAIYNETGDVIQRFGNKEHIVDAPLEVIERDISPDHFSENQYTFLDRDSGNSWVLTAPNEQKQELPSTMFKMPIVIVAGLAGAILLITLLIAFWNSFRYGSPLFIFSNWLNRMGNGNYEEVLTEQEKKKVYRKNGKLKRRYKLYKEVFRHLMTWLQNWMHPEKKESSWKKAERNGLQEFPMIYVRL